MTGSITRRIFLTISAIGAGMLTFLPASLAWAKKVAIKLANVEKLQEVGGWTILKVKERDVLLIRDAEDHVTALNPLCTHQACTVGYNPETKHIECPCHASAFGLDGTVLDGPAPEPLQTYTAELSEGRIVLDLGE